ncbi:hypothetical protein [Halosimplex pelagicum]|uniref:Uncharacterized protein n=1 Tax=Halosimplex pelagicum TaxID=869886 RepID=A0A7D5P886_9EURY|nr:hypothetical protein [Halosimplex pelagicum]QLH83357.1 hypothetical protein HZS54_17725 [Halosimplex pelagicum]
MAEPTDNNESSDDPNGPSNSGSIIDWLTQPLGIAFVGGLGAAIIAGYYLL